MPNIPMIYRTMTMIGAIQQMTPHSTFLRDRYFPCTPASDMFPTDEVLIEYRDGNRKIAPVVSPRKGGITVKRDGYTTKRFAPPLVAPKRSLTIDDLNKKGFGENLFSQITPEQREAQVLRQDLDELNIMIDGREEQMAAQAMCTNSIVLRQYIDEYGGNNYEEFELAFYDGSNDETLYTTSGDWSDPDHSIYSDLRLMVKMLTKKGLPVEDLLFSANVGDYILNNNELKAMAENRRMNLVDITPIQLAPGASRIGTINVDGHNINLISYDEQYEDEKTGELEYFIPEDVVILTASNAGRRLYGAVTQIEQHDGVHHTYMADRVPKYTADADAEVRNLKVSAKPLPIPKNKGAWVHAKVTK